MENVQQSPAERNRSGPAVMPWFLRPAHLALQLWSCVQNIFCEGENPASLLAAGMRQSSRNYMREALW